MSEINKIWYAIFDARYTYDEDAAVLLSTNDTLAGAVEEATEFGEGNVVVTLEDRPDGFSHPIASQAVYSKKRNRKR